MVVTKAKIKLSMYVRHSNFVHVFSMLFPAAQTVLVGFKAYEFALNNVQHVTCWLMFVV